ncbi:lytic transglycosylase domain-containing protein [Salidesulfovibrio onnuriiensis]|uniref:lytic transglycosylase domain-containing protein n=1 Tax=Salidesulfovibrio onnuriiensis TaxID=2583823 RepID=UPI0011C8237A|nr:lytic transglycosylase domain-containing protein [Salidesulfovibrio onnuriiensis]
MLRLPRLALPVVLLLLFFAGVCSADEFVPAQFPSLESVVRVAGPLDFCGEPVPLDNPEVRERIEREILLIQWDRAQMILWMKRTGRYFPHIERMLRLNGMPDDLKFLPVIESALRPTVGSHAGARGIWQFISSTGRKYGLRVDRYIDERRNFVFATKAAVNYLKDLHGMFGAWTLSAAAYNMGEAGLKKAIKQQETDKYYLLHLPEETQRYVVRAIVAKMIMSDPERFGFRLVPGDYYQPVQYDRIRLRCRRYTPVMLVAKAAGTTYKNIRDLNPQILRDTLPLGTHLIFLPKGAAEDFAERYKPLIAEYRAKSHGVVHKVQKGDTLLRIAQRYRISLSELLRRNKLRKNSTIHPGQTLIIRE